MINNVLISVQANLFRGVEAVGGILIITLDELLFQPHKLNIQSQESRIPLLEIESVSEKNTFGLIPNGIILNMKNGQRYQFVLWNRGKVVEIIRGLLGGRGN